VRPFLTIAILCGALAACAGTSNSGGGGGGSGGGGNSGLANSADQSSSSPNDQSGSSSADQSSSIAQDMKTGGKMQSFLQQGYNGSAVNVSDASCVESGSTQNYSCEVSYSVSAASDPTEDGNYTIGASATCDNSGNCQWKTDPLGSASKDNSTTSSGSGPCDGNPCIGDWQKEEAEGGTVVQCNDGAWSHAGGLSGACSDHGGESTSSSTNAANATPSSTGPVANQCWAHSGEFLSASPGNTCVVANNTFYEYFKASSGDPTQTESVSVWSPDDKQYYSLDCTPGEGVVDCTGPAGGDIRFTQGSITNYDDSQAAAYAAKGTLGPNG
jgi:hypothetical protein